MKNEQEKKSATTADMLRVLKNLMQENLIGFTEEEQEGLRFTLPGGQSFFICVEAVK